MNHHPKMCLILFVLILSILCSSACYSTVYYVAPWGRDDNPTSYDGTTWGRAKRSIQAAMNLARTVVSDDPDAPRDEIWVAQGNYQPFTLKAGVLVYGGFTGSEVSFEERPVPSLMTLSTFVSRVVIAAGGPMTRLDGFVVGGGYAVNGGGISCMDSSPTIANVRVANSRAIDGAGVYCKNSSPHFSNVEIYGNSASSNGGGIYCTQNSRPSFTENCIIHNNYAANGGGIYCDSGSDITFTDGHVYMNTAGENGGGIFLSNSLQTMINGTVVRNNNAEAGSGGGIYSAGSTPTLHNVIITSNYAYVSGGGVFALGGAPVLANNWITANSSEKGGGFYCSGSPSVPQVANNTFVSNCASDGGAIYCDVNSQPDIVNNIIAFNSSGFYCYGGSPSFRSNCVYGNTNYNYKGIVDPTGSSGNISVDPKLASREYGDVRIDIESPCIDAGDDSVLQDWWTDTRYEPRKVGASVDIGCDEWDGTDYDVAPRIIYVSPTGSDNNDGESWATAKATIQAAIDDLSIGAGWAIYMRGGEPVIKTGGEIWVAADTYEGRIQMRPHVNIYGGFSGVETERNQADPAANRTIIRLRQSSGDTGSLVTFRCGHDTMTIDGFTITGGSGEAGAGIYCWQSSPTIANNFISYNNAQSGGGLYCWHSSPRVLSNRFLENNATNGGAIYIDEGSNPVIDIDPDATAGNTFMGNTVTEHGGAIFCDTDSAAQIRNRNTIVGNFAGRFGGGIYCELGSHLTVEANAISANNSKSDGAGIYCADGSAVTIINNIFTGNTSQGHGGAIYSICNNVLKAPTITNNTIASNTAVGNGGAIYYWGSAAVSVNNNIIAFNSSGIFKRGYGVLTLNNNCVYENKDYNFSGMTDQTGQNGNISVDPMLNSTSFRDVHLKNSSPCIDAGLGNVVSPEWRDIDGEDRIMGANVDIGADEWTGLVPPISTRIVYVNGASGDDTNDGSSWLQAKATIQAAIDTVADTGGEVWVRAGEYGEMITVRPYVSLYGGFNGTETQRAQRNWSVNQTVIDPTKGNLSGTVVRFLAGNNWSGIDGFVIRRGNAEYGGGIYCWNSSPVIANNVIRENNAEIGGGGIYCNNDSDPQIINNTIADNAAGSGAGIYLYGSKALVAGNILQSNRQAGSGGGITCYYSDATIRNNKFTGNSAGQGAALMCSFCSPTVINNQFNVNSASDDGGGIYLMHSSAKIINNTLAGNNASSEGGGIYCGASSAPTIVNNIVAHSMPGGGIHSETSALAVLRNNCVYGNKLKVEDLAVTNYTGLQPGTGDFSNKDPRLASSKPFENMHLTEGSPCINTGDSTVVETDWVDMDGQPRLHGTVDIGADETAFSTAPVNLSLSPNSGPLTVGNKFTLTAGYWDPDGHTDLTWCLLLINSELSGNDSIYLYYDAASNRLHLRDDADSTWGAGAAPGSATVLENSAVRVYCAETTVSKSGPDLVVAWRLELKSAMSGKTCPVWMKTRDTAGLMDEWEQKGIFSIDQGPRNVSLSPNVGTFSTGVPLTYTTVYSDPDGYDDLTWCLLLINTELSGSNAVYLYYDVANGTLHLRDDEDTTWGVGAVPGSAMVLENSVVKLNCADTTVVKSGNSITINWRIEFKPAMTGKTCPAWMLTRDVFGHLDGWKLMGDFIIGQAPSVGDLTPNTGPIPVEVPTTVTGVYSDPDGAGNLKYCCFLMNTRFDGINAVYLLYEADTNLLYVRDTADTTWGTGYLIGSDNVISNGFVKVYCADTTAVESGNDITVNWRIELDKYWAGKAMDVWLRPIDKNYLGFGWNWRGNLLAGNAPVSISLSPNSGAIPTGSYLPIRSDYSDQDGFQSINGCYLLINTSKSTANAIYAYYDSANNLLYVRNDADTAWIGGFAPGTANVIGNSKFNLDCATTTVSKAGATVTVNWKIQPLASVAGQVCPAWMRVTDGIGLSEDWKQMGSFNF